MRSYARLLAWVQGLCFAAFGSWEILVGAAREGILILVIGAVILWAVQRGALDGGVVVVAAMSALGLACVDVIGVSTRSLPPGYLLEAAFDLLLVVAWGTASRAPRAARPEGKPQARSAR